MAERLEIIIGAKDEFSGAFNKLSNALPSIGQMAKGAGIAVAGVSTALIAMTKATANQYDAVRKFSDQLGVSTEFLSKYGLAAEFSGVKQETFNKSIQMLQVRIGEAHRGIGQGKDALNALGVALYTTTGQLKTSEQILPELADAFHNMSNATERAEAASKIFGQRGMAMLQMFKGGKEGLAEFTAEAEKFGLVISEKAANNAAEFNDSLTRVSGSLKGVRNAISEQLMPVLAGLANKFADFVADNRDAIVNFAESFLTAMGRMVEYSAYGVAAMVEGWRGLQMVWSVLKIAFAEFSIAINEGINFLIEKFTWMLTKVNFRGIFDNDIAALNAVKANAQGAITELVAMKETALNSLTSLAADPSAFEKVDQLKEYFKSAMVEIRAAGMGTAEGEEGEEGEGGGEPQGIGIATTANIVKTQENLQALQDMFNEYTMSDLELLDLWFSEQQTKFAGNWEAQTQLLTIYTKRMSDIQTKYRKQLETEDAKHKAQLKTEDAKHKAELEKADLKDKKDKAERDRLFSSDKIKMTNQLGSDLTTMASVFGKKGVIIAKAASLPKAIMSMFTGAAKALELPYPANLFAAASVLATGAGFISSIQGAAHGGLSNVPKEATYLLDKGERVLSPQQNKELMEFMKNGGSGGSGVHIENITINTQENLEGIDWNEFAEDKLIPAFSYAAKNGIVIQDV